MQLSGTTTANKKYVFNGEKLATSATKFKAFNYNN